MKKLEIAFLVPFIVWTLFIILTGVSLGESLIIYVPLIGLYCICWLIRDAIEEKKKQTYNMKKDGYQENRQTDIPYSSTGLNRTLYRGMNGKPVELWKIIIGVLLLVGGAFMAISTAIDSGVHWQDAHFIMKKVNVEIRNV